jgi:UDP-N-acetylglucosamine 2-epimerase (non-hydrolysing)
MKVLTVLGTRPEIIRLSLIVAKLDLLCDHTVLHTGQNFAATLSDNMFRDLGVRLPDRQLNVGPGHTTAEQIGAILRGTELQIASTRPDRVLVLGDTNSGLAAYVAKRAGIRVFHLEAGNRCFDDRVPEEVNRRVIDQCSDVLMPYTERSRQNLLAEGFSSEQIFVVGNPINEVLVANARAIDRSTVLAELGLMPERFFLVTMHRAENVDDAGRLHSLVECLHRLHSEHGDPVVVSVHPHTRLRLETAGLTMASEGIQMLPPFGFHDFVHLERHAKCILTDSGTVQEEACILRVPSVTIRDATERPETLECGSNILSGVDPVAVLGAVRVALSSGRGWTPPTEYLQNAVSDTVVRLVLSGVDGRAR